ncbi:Putative rhamnose biosynthetic enzyme 1 [Durusdinium trenchii]|uniref:Rhamnose biosynthetic enzyme 1 n=1 Tax=Durusdinium trenchii TaxID=1381693 RepID=A0ABP0NT61_9DINO
MAVIMESGILAKAIYAAKPFAKGDEIGSAPEMLESHGPKPRSLTCGHDPVRLKPRDLYMMAMLLQLALMCVVLPAHGVDDTKTSLEEPQWYKAAEHLQSWIAWAKEWQGTHDLMCLDLFGASNKIQACWTRRRFMASAFDIAQDASQDIVSPTGFAQLVNLGLRLAPNAIVVGGPPCSWFGFMSSSVHLRHRYPPNGATWIRGVRLSNLIVKNMVAWVAFFMIILAVNPTLQILLEQPRGSWLFKMRAVRKLIRQAGLKLVRTHMGCFDA